MNKYKIANFLEGIENKLLKVLELSLGLLGLLLIWLVIISTIVMTKLLIPLI